MKPDAWEPCPADMECLDCGHTMVTHWTFSTGCRVEGCTCTQWCCQHSGPLAAAR